MPPQQLFTLTASLPSNTSLLLSAFPTFGNHGNIGTPRLYPSASRVPYVSYIFQLVTKSAPQAALYTASPLALTFVPHNNLNASSAEKKTSLINSTLSKPLPSFSSGSKAL